MKGLHAHCNFCKIFLFHGSKWGAPIILIRNGMLKYQILLYILDCHLKLSFFSKISTISIADPVQSLGSDEFWTTTELLSRTVLFNVIPLRSVLLSHFSITGKWNPWFSVQKPKLLNCSFSFFTPYSSNSSIVVSLF